MPGGMLPDMIVQVSTPPPLFIKNSSAFCPTLRAGSTHTPFTMVPPLVLGEHSCVSPCTARAGLAAARPASNVPATTTAAIVLFTALPRCCLCCIYTDTVPAAVIAHPAVRSFTAGAPRDGETKKAACTSRSVPSPGGTVGHGQSPGRGRVRCDRNPDAAGATPGAVRRRRAAALPAGTVVHPDPAGRDGAGCHRGVRAVRRGRRASAAGRVRVPGGRGPSRLRAGRPERAARAPRCAARREASGRGGGAARSNQRIAHDLVVALDRFKKHVTHVLGKLGAANRTEAAARARQLGLIPLTPHPSRPV